MSATVGVAFGVVRQHLAAAETDVQELSSAQRKVRVSSSSCGGRRGQRVSASAVPSAGTPPSSALSRLIGLPNNQTPSESSKLSVVPFAAF